MPYWYSDGSQISKFTSESVIYDVTQYSDCDIDPTDLDSYFSKADLAWDSVFDVTFTKYNPLAHSGVDIDAGCVSRDYADSQSWPGIWVGASSVLNKTFTGSYYKPNFSGVASFYTHSDSFAYAIWDDDGTDGSVSTDWFGLPEWWNVTAHEFGHSIGFIGHNTMGNTQLMHSSRNWFFQPAGYDKAQMNLVYLYE